jgi:hypothetical protein
MADEEQGEPRMSAECRVEGLPLSAADISIDGLRLRLDIRIVPRAQGDAASGDSAAMFRVVSAKIAAKSRVPAYQWAAMMVGLGVLVVALVLWFAAPARGPLASESSPASFGATPPPASLPPPRPLPTGEIIAPPPPSATATAAAPPPAQAPQVETAPPPRRAEPRKTAATSASARQTVAAAAPPPRADSSVASYNPQPVARGRGRDDMLDLFGDTK